MHPCVFIGCTNIDMEGRTVQGSKYSNSLSASHVVSINFGRRTVILLRWNLTTYNIPLPCDACDEVVPLCADNAEQSDHELPEKCNHSSCSPRREEFDPLVCLIEISL